MTQKVYEIVPDADGWSCRAGGDFLGSFSSWLMAIRAARVAAEADSLAGISTSIRHQDLKGVMHTVSPTADSTDPFAAHHDKAALTRIDRLAGTQKQHS